MRARVRPDLPDLPDQVVRILRSAPVVDILAVRFVVNGDDIGAELGEDNRRTL